MALLVVPDALVVHTFGIAGFRRPRVLVAELEAGLVGGFNGDAHTDLIGIRQASLVCGCHAGRAGCSGGTVEGAPDLIPRTLKWVRVNDEIVVPALLSNLVANAVRVDVCAGTIGKSAAIISTVGAVLDLRRYTARKTWHRSWRGYA